MTSPTTPPAASEAAPTPGQPVRSEGLLPAAPDDPAPEVAEEVNLDQQSERARRVGAAPDVPVPEEPLDEALKERLPPPQ